MNRDSSSAPAARLRILGLGNVLLSDDGIGPRAVELLRAGYELPPAVEVLDGGTLGMSLLGWISETETVLLVDAVQTGERPGTLVRLEGDDVEPAVRERLSPHQVGVADLLDALRLLDASPRQLVLLGLVPESLELAVELTPSVERALPALVERIAAEAAALGFPLAPRAIRSDEASPLPAARLRCPEPVPVV